ncbi:MAG TPA: VWA domain-containing protein [Pyrinomonadaceae bacterium]|jgi:VWFA-related protein
MKHQHLLAFALVLLLCAAASGQQASQPQPSPTQSATADDVVRITTNLVQVDALVLDKKGRQVTDLRPEDFEVFEDGRRQKITNFSYIELNTAQPPQPSTRPSPAEKGAPLAPPVRLRPEQVRRTIALVVDDYGLSFESAYMVRRALKKFVDEQMQPGDLVAILRTTAGIGALQQFTSDKRQLYAAMERVRGSLVGLGGGGAFAPLRSMDAEGGPPGRDLDRPSPEDEINEFREELFAIGTLGALNYVVRGLKDLPGRKAVVLLSEGLPIFDSRGRSDRILESLRRLVDLSNRAAVVIYTMDARGLQPFGLTAADDTSRFSIDQLERVLSDRRRSYFESQNGLNYLAQQTGGMFIHDTNDLSGGFRRILEDQKGYYLIGYRPDESTFEPGKGGRRFHKISVKVNRPGLRVRSRTGFYGITDEQAIPARKTREEQLAGALVSPFSSGDIHVRLTSLFGNDPRTNSSFMRSMMYIDTHDLAFTMQSDGSHKATLDVAAITFGDKGLAVDQVARTYELRLKEEDYRRIIKHGLIYTLNVPVKKAGAYQLRVAVRDAATERVGSAGQFVEVPNLAKNRLALSGLILGGMNPAAAQKTSASETAAESRAPVAPESANASTGAAEMYDAQAGPAVRRLTHGMLLDFGYVIYNAQLDRATSRPQLTTQVRLFRDGQPVFTGKELPFNADRQTDLKRLVAGGRLSLGTNLPPGEYVLQVIVRDALAKEKYRTASQWIDFEIVK